MRILLAFPPGPVMKMAHQASALTTRLVPQPTHCCAHRGRIALQCPAGGCNADRYGTQRRSFLLHAIASETPVKVENEIDNFPTEMCRAALCGGMDLEQVQRLPRRQFRHEPWPALTSDILAFVSTDAD